MKAPHQLLATTGKIAIPIAIIGFLVYKIKPEEWTALTEHPKNYPLLVGAISVALAAMCLSFARWWLLVRCQGIDLSFLEAFRISSICFVLSFVSVGSVGGDLFKAIFLARRRPGKRVEAVASVFVDRGVGLYGLLLLATAAFLIHGTDDPLELADQNMQRLKTGAAVLSILGTAVLAVLVFGGKFVDRMVRWCSRLPVIGGIVAKIGPPLRMFHNHPIAFGMSILMSVGVHVGLTTSMYLVARSLYADVPTFAEHFIIVPLAMLASALPITPAGIGVLEATMKWLYELIPAQSTTASGTLVALAFEMVKVVLAAVGTVFYWTAGEEVRQSLEEAEHVDEPASIETAPAASDATVE